MANITIAIKNALDTGASWYGQEDGGSYTMTNLTNPIFGKVWRLTPGTNADGNVARLAASVSSNFRTTHLALCRHNLGEGAQLRLRAGSARFNADFVSENPFTHDITFGGGTNGTRTNEYGLLVSNGCPRYEHDRRYYDNGLLWSEDMSNVIWTENSCKKLDTQAVDFPKAGGFFHQRLMQLYADTYEVKAQVQLVSGDPTFAFNATASGISDNLGDTKTATSDWQWFTSSIVVSSASAFNGARVGLQKLVGAGVLKIRRIQISRGSSGGKYRKTTDKRRYQRIGLITEAAATNGLLWCQDWTNAAWTKTVTVAANTGGVSPDGGLNVTTLTAGTTGQLVSQDQTLGGTTTRGLSLVIKQGGTCTSAALAIQWLTGGTTQNVTVNFNPSTGAFISSSNTGATLGINGARDLGGGFWRIYVVGIGTDALNTVVRSSLTLNTTGTVIVYASQNEATSITSQIFTTSAAVARTVDTAVVEPTAWVPYVWNQAEGTVYHEVQGDEVSVANGVVMSNVSVRNAAGTTNIESRLTATATASTHNFALRVTLVSVLSYVASSVGATAGQPTRLAYRYRDGDWNTYTNGTATTGSTTATIGTSITAINLMQGPGSATTYLRRVAIWPTGKTDAEVQALSVSGPGAIDHDSGWVDAMQAQMQDPPALWGYDFDVIRPFTARNVEWMRLEMYDPDKTSASTPFEIGRAFMGKVLLQPKVNADWGIGYGWRERATPEEAADGRKFFLDKPRVRDMSFAFKELSPAEMAKVHEIQNKGTSQEVLVLCDPDDPAECQRYGFVGLLKELDRITYPKYATREVAFSLEKKR